MRSRQNQCARFNFNGFVKSNVDMHTRTHFSLDDAGNHNENVRRIAARGRKINEKFFNHDNSRNGSICLLDAAAAVEPKKKRSKN